MLTLRAAQLLRAAPDFPGRPRTLAYLRRRLRRVRRPIVSRFGPGLYAEIIPSEGQMGPLLLRYTQPSLHRVFEAVLREGDVVVDVGANQGIYSLLGAHLVGTRGRVLAFEPGHEALERLRRNVAINGFSNIQIVDRAVGSETGRVVLHRVIGGGSGLTSRYGVDHGRTEPFEAPMTTLDEHLGNLTRPALVKIDVEGMELDVLRGARGLMAAEPPPAIVFELGRARSGGDGSLSAFTALFDAAGMQLYALTTRGLQSTEARECGADNVLALRPSYGRHAAILAELQNVRFPRYQEL